MLQIKLILGKERSIWIQRVFSAINLCSHVQTLCSQSLFSLLFSLWFSSVFWKLQPDLTMRKRSMENIDGWMEGLRGTWPNSLESDLVVSVGIKLNNLKWTKEKNGYPLQYCCILILSHAWGHSKTFGSPLPCTPGSCTVWILGLDIFFVSGVQVRRAP